MLKYLEGALKLYYLCITFAKKMTEVTEKEEFFERFT